MEIFDVIFWLIEVDQDTDLAVLSGLENGVK